MRDIVTGLWVMTMKRVRGEALHFFEHAAEAIDVGVVERRIDFVQHAERRGIGEEHREDERGGGQRLFAAGEQRADW